MSGQQSGRTWRIALRSANGAELVHETTLPVERPANQLGPMNLPPDVVTWQGRVFRNTAHGTGQVIYREATHAVVE